MIATPETLPISLLKDMTELDIKRFKEIGITTVQGVAIKTATREGYWSLRNFFYFNEDKAIKIIKNARALCPIDFDAYGGNIGTLCGILFISDDHINASYLLKENRPVPEVQVENTKETPLDYLISRIENIIPYVVATISYGNSKTFDGVPVGDYSSSDSKDWMLIHKGRAHQSTKQLEHLLKLAQEMKK